MKSQVADGRDRANIYQDAYFGEDFQHFALNNTGDGYVELLAAHSNSALDVQSASTAPNTNVWQFAFNGSDAQIWELIPVGDGSFYIVSKLSGYYLGYDEVDNVRVEEFTGNTDHNGGLKP